MLSQKPVGMTQPSALRFRQALPCRIEYSGAMSPLIYSVTLVKKQSLGVPQPNSLPSIAK